MATGYNLRVGDADREAIAAQLREHYADGRLTLEELNERLDQTFAARTRADLNLVMRDLPHITRPLAGAAAGGAGSTGWQGTRDPAWPGPASRSGWDHSDSAGHGRRAFVFAPMLALLWVALVAGAVMLFGIGGDKPLALILIFAAFALLKRLFRFGTRGRARGSRGPKGPRGPRRGSRGPRF
jgi:Domain of unknown function (DUF1707)